MSQSTNQQVRQLLDVQASIGTAIFYMTENDGGFLTEAIRLQITHAIQALEAVDTSNCGVATERRS